MLKVFPAELTSVLVPSGAAEICAATGDGTSEVIVDSRNRGAIAAECFIAGNERQQDIDSYSHTEDFWGFPGINK